MSLSSYALVSLAEAKDFIGLGGTTKDPILESIISRVTDEIEDHLGRWIVCPTGDATRGTLTEFHTFQADGDPVCTANLRTLEWPIISVTGVYEDTAVPRTYSSALVSGTDYEVIKPKGLIRRLCGGAGATMPWATAHRAVKVVYTAGYTSTSAVPERIKAVALRYVSLIWSEASRGDFGMYGRSDALGNYTRYATPKLTAEMAGALTNERRHAFWLSGERDA